jgi:hypothetical protein
MVSVPGKSFCDELRRSCFAPGMAAKTPQVRLFEPVGQVGYLRCMGMYGVGRVAAPRSCSEQPARVPK